MATPNRYVPRNTRVPSFVDKADLQVAQLTGTEGELNPEQVMSFMAIQVAKSKFREQARTVIMKRDTIEIPKMTTLGAQTWWPASEYTALPLSQRVRPGFTGETMTVREVMCSYKYPKHFLKVQVEGDTFQRTLLAYLGDHTRRDWERLIIQGDTVAGANSFLRLFNGVIGETTTYTYAAGTVDLSRGVLQGIRFSLPVEFRDQEGLEFWTSEEAQSIYADSIGARMTAKGDDHELNQVETPLMSGRRVNSLPLMPTTLGGGTDTDCIYMNPRNMMTGMRETMELYTDWDSDTRSYTVTGVAWITQGMLHEAYNVLGTGIVSVYT